MPGPAPTPAYDRVMRRSSVNTLSSYENTPCLECNMATSGAGYPVVSDGGRQITAANAVWEHKIGRVPDGLVVIRLCRNPACVSIRHLSVGTFKEEAARRQPSLGAAKLSRVDVANIRAQTTARHTELARDYGVTPRTIANIRRKRTWRGA